MVRSLLLALMVWLIAPIPNSRLARADDETIKLAYVGPMSGSWAQYGAADVSHLRWILSYVNAHNAPLGKSFELVTFDHKMQPAEGLAALKQIIDQNIPIVIEEIGSNVLLAMLNEVTSHNRDIPDHRVLLLNAGSNATFLTNDKCNFWHFRFIASSEQRAYATIRSLPPSIKKVYMLNPDFPGHSAEVDAKRFLAELRPDIDIVGSEFVPPGQLKDFSPQVGRIKESGAQSLLTANFGPDLTLLLKAALDAGLEIRFDTQFGGEPGVVAEVGRPAIKRLNTIAYYYPNLAVEQHDAAAEAFNLDFRRTHDSDFAYSMWLVMVQMLSRAINEVGSVNAFDIALELEDARQTDLAGATETMRKADHQLVLPLYAAVLSDDVKYGSEGTPFGWKTTDTIRAEQLSLPTTCAMQRPVD